MWHGNKQAHFFPILWPEGLQIKEDTEITAGNYSVERSELKRDDYSV